MWTLLVFVLVSTAIASPEPTVQALIDEGGSQCVQEHKPKITECAKKWFSEKLERIDSQYSSCEIFDSTETCGEKLKDRTNEQKMRLECQALVDLKTCVKNELDQCHNPSSSTFVTDIIDSIYNETITQIDILYP